VQNKKEVDKKINIGMCFDSFIIERWQRDRDAFVAKATKELGANVNIQNANGDVDEQVKQIDYFIDKKVDVIVIVAIDSEAVTEAVKRAKKENIKVIAYDRLIRNANVDLYITFDNEKVGTLMAQSIKQNIPDNGHILMMCGPLEDNNVPLVQDGFAKALEDSNIQVMATGHANGWIAETGFEFVSEYLSKDENIDAIMCGNDGIASQVIHALSERRIAGKVCVVGQDADLDACQRIVEGTQKMTVYKPVEQLAQKAAEYAVALGKGEYMAAPNTFYDGVQEVPYEGLEPIAVTKENMDVIINDGYHLEEDIYLNVQREE
jgi:D-xylose transport system substrate-binding protein